MTTRNATIRSGGTRHVTVQELEVSATQPALEAPWRGLENLEARLMMSADPGPAATLWAQADGGNGNWYEAVAAPGGISWQDAQAAANARGGHLVTLTSALENDFVFSLIDDPIYWNQLPVLGTYSLGPWIGAFRPDGAGSDPAADWQWVTGENWDFTNWATVEPDRSDENFAHYTGREQVTEDTWANWVANHGLFPIVSYVIEWEAEDVAPDNTAPAFDSTPVNQVLQNHEYRYDIAASDGEGDPLQILSADLPDWLSLTDNGDGTATLLGTPGAGDVGVYEVVLQVTDGDLDTEQRFSIDVQALGRIAGVAFEDMNANGVQDTGEQAFSGWTVFLDDNGNGLFDDGERSVLTDETDRYEFNDLDPGDYQVGLMAPAAEGYALDELQIHCSWRNTYLDLREGDMVSRTDLDDHTYLLGFEDWVDRDFNDLILKITEFDDGEVLLQVHDRNAAGHFDLVTQDGEVVLSRLGERHGTPVGSEMLLNRQWTFTTGAVQTVSVASGETAEADFGATHPTRQDITGTLWHDVNGDGVRDDGEDALAGWRVYIDGNDNGQWDDGERYATTGSDGAYAIEDLGAGQYALRSESPFGNKTLDDLQVYCSWRGTYLDLMEGSMVRRTDLGDGTYLLGFEDWIDRDFNDLVLKVGEQADGTVTVTVWDRNAAGHFDLVDRQGNVLMDQLAERRGTPEGTSFTLGETWEFTTGEMGVHMVDLVAGSDAQLDMGARQQQDEPAPEPDPQPIQTVDSLARAMVFQHHTMRAASGLGMSLGLADRFEPGSQSSFANRIAAHSRAFTAITRLRSLLGIGENDEVDIIG